MFRFQICYYNSTLTTEIFNFNIFIKGCYVPLLASKIYFYSPLYKNQLLTLILSHMNPTHSLFVIFIYDQFNITLPSTHWP